MDTAKQTMKYSVTNTRRHEHLITETIYIKIQVTNTASTGTHTFINKYIYIYTAATINCNIIYVCRQQESRQAVAAN